MPIIRSRSPVKSKSDKEESAGTSTTDWSLETPVSTETETSEVTAGTTASRRTVATTSSAASVALEPTAPASGRRTRAASAATVVAAPPPRPAAAAAAAAAKEPIAAQTRSSKPATTTSANVSHAPAPAFAHASELGRSELVFARPSSVPAPLTAASVSASAVASAATQRTKGSRNTTKNIGGRPTAPPFASSETLIPRKPGRSVKSSKRTELEALREYQKKQLEAAQAAAALAQTDLELAEYASEEEQDEEYEIERSTNIEQWVQHTNTFLENQDPINDEPTQKSEIKELADAIIDATRSIRPSMTVSPKIWDLPEFNGSHEEWLPFKKAFEDSASMCTAVHNMARLRKAVKGAAKEAIRSLLFVTSEPQDIIAALERRFGRPEQLVLAELQKIKELPRVGDTPKDICIFSSRVCNAVTTITALKKPHYLYSPEISRSITEKLSPILRYRWLDYSARIGDDEPELLKMKKFLEAEADLCGKMAPPELALKKRYPVHATREDEIYETNTVAATSEGFKKFCAHCEGEHWITECKKFRDASNNERWEIAVKNKLCFKCLRKRHMNQNCRSQPCRKCKKPHHIMLHTEQTYKAPPTTQEKPALAPRPTSEESVVKPVFTATDGTKTYLKMVPVDVYGPKGSTRVLALLDEGSTVSLLDKNVADRIGATGKEEALILETVGGKIIEKKNSQKMDLKIKGASRRDRRTLRGVRTIEDLKLSPQTVSKSTIEGCNHLKEMMNELLYEKERPTLLIGQDNWDLIVSRKILKGKQSEPVASLTSLGWVLHGSSTGSAAAPVHYVNHCCKIENEEAIDELIKRHFDLESIGVQQRRPSNDADGRALQLLEKTTNQLPDGRYESGLLWKKDDEKLPNNYAQAYNRLLGVEKRLDKDAALKEEYGKQLQKLLDSGYAEEAPADRTPDRTFYLPHFSVVHPIKKKIRIVFDAAAKYEGKSLNDALLPGPDLLQSLFGVLLRFREGPVAVVADIKEMFLQIRIRQEDRDVLRFLWRGEDRRSKPKEYRMKSVIFGAASSPATAIFVKNSNAKNHEKEHPAAAKAIIRNHYMDDYLQSFRTKEEAAKVAEEVNKVHRAANFELRQWASNEKEIIMNMKTEDSPKEKRLGNEEKTLGMRWLVDEDALAFNVGLRNTPEELTEGKRLPTKREVTSAVMSTFDPIGLAVPVLIKGKRIIQNIWRIGTKWDETINEEQYRSWLEYIEDIKALQHLKIPRCLAPFIGTGELHTFVDASETAYAAAAYWRTIGTSGEVHLALIAGKARVAPVKTTSIPRLELQAALLGGRLAATIAEEIDLVITRKTFWSDSSTVLQWIKSDPRRFKTFVAHRLAELEDLTKPREWRWVPTKENPADDATRDTPKEFNETSRWFNGPAFLLKPESEWPNRKFEGNIITGEEKKNPDTVSTARIKEDLMTPDPNRFSSWTRLLRATARVFIFLDLCRRKKARTNATREKNWKPYQKKEKTNTSCPRIMNSENRTWAPIETEYLKKTEKALIKQSQRKSFQKEIENLKRSKPLENSSRLKKIDVILDEDEILRLNSRAMKIREFGSQNLRLPIMDGKYRVAQLLIEHHHRHLHHGNHATVINEMRQKFWILSLRNAVKKVSSQCQWCRMKRSRPEVPPLGNLPPERLVHHQPPFTCTGVDYFGPMHVTIGRRKEKRWGALFTCLTTRAVHLELAASLSTSSMIMALRRMAARRGTPRTIYSDNGTNFVGADNELKKEIARMPQELVEAAEKEGITWKFIPPGAPNMGGAWERLVRSVKTALAAVLGEKSPPEEVLLTLLTEVEHTLNSRPLTHLTADPRDEESLTPNHFLIGRSCGMAVLANFDDTDLIGKPNWKTAQRLADHFWTRWLKEYLPTLMPRKMNNRDQITFEKGDVVLIADQTLPRNTWPRGIIQETFPGPDERTRIVTVMTRRGLMKRPTSRLILLASVKTLQPKDGVPDDTSCTGGENVSNV